MLTGPAFVLGNSPYLPEHLECLRGRFSVGVNRIALRYTPTVIVWVDSSVYKDPKTGLRTAEGEQMDTCGALLVCDQSVADRAEHVGLHTLVGDPAISIKGLPDRLCVNGSTGAAAARWACALGCDPVYLVGMDCRYLNGVSDFYGDNPWHHRDPEKMTTLALMHTELARLKKDWPNVVTIHGQRHLDEVAGECAEVDESAIREMLRAGLTR